MAEAVTLRGITWDHSRGYDPMVATAQEFAKQYPNVTITWDRRSLQAFADRPIKDMTIDYDLLVIDHPHVGEVARDGNLLAFDERGHDAELATLAQQSVGVSHRSYEFEGRQWALAIDAATPVAAYRPDLLATPPTRWDEVSALAKEGQVACALIPINALMTFLGLARNRAIPIATSPDLLMPAAAAADILAEMRSFAALLDPRCLALDPIGIYEWLGRTATAPAYSPFGYGYTNYSRDGYCPYPLVFADAPGWEDQGPQGTVLGGTGIAIAAQTKHPDIAVAYAFYVAQQECQAGLYFTAGGQPGNAGAWDDDSCNAQCRNFFRNTRATLETAWLRPRYAGYMEFQNQAGDIVHACLRAELDPNTAAAQLQELHCKSAAV